MNGFQHRPAALLVAGAALIALVSATAGYWFARRTAAPPQALARERKPLYWYDPMQPAQHFDQPGKSPFMPEMDLVPVYPDDAEPAAGVPAQGGPAQKAAPAVRIDPSLVQNLGIRLSTVERGPLVQRLEAVGTVGFNQRDVAVIQARTAGFVTHVHRRAPGDVIGKGAPVVDLLVPEWAGAQTEFLALLHSGERTLIEAARQRMRLLGMPTELIEQVESTRAEHTTVTITTPLAGVIETLDVRDGMAVPAGATLARIDGLASVWVEAALPEAQALSAPIGKPVEVRLPAYPGESFRGAVIAVLPQANVETRTLRVRIELANPRGRLRPGMFSQVLFDSSGAAVPVLHVASESVIHTGLRTVVIVAGEQGRFIPTEVRTGAEINGRTVILSGLQAGDRVVASGQFLIDSEASLKGVLARLGGEP